MINGKMKYWMMNVIIDSLQSKLDHSIKEKANQLGLTGKSTTMSMDDMNKFHLDIEELKNNEMSAIGKVNMTMEAMIKARDEWSVSIAQDMCKHPHDKITIKDDCVTCDECQKEVGGWSCPTSPEKICHYFTDSDEHGFYVTLMDGVKHYIKDYTQDMADEENEDSCLFCGEPDERK